MVVVDRFTKIADCIGLHENVTVKDVEDTLLPDFWTLHVLRTEIISDMDAKLAGEF